ncbi:chlamydia polymorphic membrane protein [Methanobrevibacter cuticularis]|uniref:Chlamydia polymorphic membrane protein n=1 Tax=Methanobrevibacter cuticularis TaxID=47311 RepID=A0A166CST3_9EURY|nr:hypothetical protein [Methanobrevibacter cuticularis]KZX14825.1 chlamydia polymorphic membrane protein [Methanobrevibacter cuticularis]
MFTEFNSKKLSLLIILSLVVAIGVMASVDSIDAKKITITKKSSLTDGIKKCKSGDTLVLASGTWSGKISKNRNIVIDKNIKIVAKKKGKSIIDLKGKGQAFYVNSGVKLTLDGVTIKNGNAPYSASDQGLGGAIFSSGTLKISNCIFSKNKCAIGDRGDFGGAINGDKLTVINSVFMYNTVKNGAGGAIYTNGNVSISGCTFVSNKAIYGSGGAICLGSTAGYLKVSNSIFKSNKAKYKGGAISAYSKSSVKFSKNTYKNNIAPKGSKIYYSN